MKQQIVQEISEKLASIGLVPRHDGKSDLEIDQELVEAQLGSGAKSIHYENAVLVHEKDKCIYLYEKTTEKSKGFSFGSSSESSFQSGKTLSRHVKGSFVGTNGVHVEYDFDLGQIPKLINEVATKNGFKFKTVIRRKSAEN